MTLQEEVEYEVEVEYEEGDSVVIDSEYDEGEWIDEERQSGDGEVNKYIYITKFLLLILNHIRIYEGLCTYNLHEL